jgi:RNA polymerase sigma-70 factor (ECF subfamily)
MCANSVVLSEVSTCSNAGTLIFEETAVTTLLAALPRDTMQATPPRDEIGTHGEYKTAAQTVDYGQRKRINDLYERLQAPLTAYLRRLDVSVEDCEDIIHESFLRLITHLLVGAPEVNLRGWLFQVTYNLSIDIHRENRHFFALSLDESEGLSGKEEPVDTAADPQENAIREEMHRRLSTAVAQLTQQQKKCLLLRAEGMRYREIASVLGVSIQRVAKILEQGTAYLAEHL